MVDDQAKGVLQDVAVAISEAEARLPTARELLRILVDAGEDTTEVQALIAEIEGRIKQWTRTLKREGIEVPTESGSKKG